MKTKSNVTVINEKITETNKLFVDRKKSSFEHGREREELIGQAIVAIGKECGIELENPLHMNSKGEYNLIVLKPGQNEMNKTGCGPFGEKFAALLNEFPFRNGILATSGYVQAESGWGWINHFDAEKLVANYVKNEG